MSTLKESLINLLFTKKGQHVEKLGTTAQPLGNSKVWQGDGVTINLREPAVPLSGAVLCSESGGGESTISCWCFQSRESHEYGDSPYSASNNAERSGDLRGVNLPEQVVDAQQVSPSVVGFWTTCVRILGVYTKNSDC